MENIKAGYYWRALRRIHDENIDQDEVLLVSSVKWADGKPHTIVLRAHPEKFGKYIEVGKSWNRREEHRFLVKDFLKLFVLEPNFLEIRKKELARVQDDVNKIQNELLAAQSNPVLMQSILEQEFSQLGSGNPKQEEKDKIIEEESLGEIGKELLVQMSGGMDLQSVSQLKANIDSERQIAEYQAKWIKLKTDEIAAEIERMTPYYQEQAAAALARTEDIQEHISHLLSGIKSLDLYVGNGVVVNTIRKGKGAPKEIPLTIVQKKLLMDEELAVYCDVDEWFDFTKMELFFEAIRKHDGLIDQIFPSQRCVLLMATTRRYIDYKCPFTNAIKNDENRVVFLLIRDGMNVYQIYSSVESHLGADKLFPTLEDSKSIFRDFNGEDIKYFDTQYTDSLKQFESKQLHYRRLLLLLCGLDHRLKLLGDFYDGPPSMQFMSMAFQQKYFHLLHDDDISTMLPGQTRMGVMEWVKNHNKQIVSGSRILCMWDNIPTREKEKYSSYKFKNDMDIAICYRKGTTLYVDCEMEMADPWGRAKRKEYKKKYDVNQASYDSICNNSLAVLCLDAVSIDDLKWYIHHRGERRNHLFYIRFFKTALQFLEKERKEEAPTRKALANALMESKIVSEKEECDKIIDQTVIAWRATNRGQPLPAKDKISKDLLDQMYALAKREDVLIKHVQEFIDLKNLKPLRFVMSGKSSLFLYAEPLPTEQNNILEPFAWVHKIAIERKKSGVIEKRRSWSVLKDSVSEHILKEWPENATPWINLRTVFPSYAKKQDMINLCIQGDKLVKFIFGADHFSEEDIETYYNCWRKIRDQLNYTGKYVKEVSAFIPLGMVGKSLICIRINHTYPLLYLKSPNQEWKDKIRKEAARLYNIKQTIYDELDNLKNFQWSMGLCGFNLKTKDFPVAFAQTFDGYISQRGETIQERITRDHKKSYWVADENFVNELLKRNANDQ